MNNKEFRLRTDKELGLSKPKASSAIIGAVLLFFAVIGVVHSCKYVFNQKSKHETTQRFNRPTGL